LTGKFKGFKEAEIWTSRRTSGFPRSPLPIALCLPVCVVMPGFQPQN